MLKKSCRKKSGIKLGLLKKTESNCFLAPSIKKIYLEDDALKIEYTNNSGNIETLDFTSYQFPDVGDVEYFLINTVNDYQFLCNFGKALYKKLRENINRKVMRYGKLKRTDFSRFFTGKSLSLMSKTRTAKKTSSKNVARKILTRSVCI